MVHAGPVRYCLRRMGLGLRVRYRSSEGAAHGETIATQLPVRFGRNSLNDCVIDHPQVSQFHAVVELIDGQLGVRDLNSTNGVYTASSGRLQAGQFLPLAATANVFALGPSVQVHVEPFEQGAQAGLRPSPVQGQVLGRPSMLDELRRAPSRPAAPAAPPFGPPSVEVARPVASLPPLSVDERAAPVRPPPQPVGAYAPGASGAGGDRQSLPPLAPLSAEQGAGRAFGSPAPYAPPPGGPGEGQRAVRPSTQQLSLTLEGLALTGLRELAGSLVPGVPLQTTGDVARLLTKLHDTIEVLCRTFVPLRMGHEQFVSSMQLQRAAGQRSVDRSPSALRLEMARDPATVAAALLDWRNQDFDAPKVAESILADLVMHHVALVEGVMRGIQALLEDLSPDAIEKQLADQGSAAVLGRHRALWQTYKERHRELSSESKSFATVFGEEFAASYREYLEQQRRGGR